MSNKFENGFDGFGGEVIPIEEERKTMYLSTQALQALMMALQKSLLEQSDIVPILKAWQFADSTDGLVVLNPPMVRMPDNMDGEE